MGSSSVAAGHPHHQVKSRHVFDPVVSEISIFLQILSSIDQTDVTILMSQLNNSLFELLHGDPLQHIFSLAHIDEPGCGVQQTNLDLDDHCFRQ